MMGLCLLCGFVTPDLDILDRHVARHEQSPRRAVARSLWRSYGFCPRCGANQDQPCRTFPGENVCDYPHADREHLNDQGRLVPLTGDQVQRLINASRELIEL